LATNFRSEMLTLHKVGSSTLHESVLTIMTRPSRGFGLISFFIIHILTSLTSALQANLAGIVDWHKPLIGPPLLEPTPPSFIGDRIVAITRKNVLAVLEAESGAVIWRHLLDDRDPVVSYHVQDDSKSWVGVQV